MDVGAIRQLEVVIGSEHNNILTAVSRLKSQTSSLIGSAWIGQSASEFGQQIEEVYSQQISVLDRLHELRAALASEISQWEDMAARMG
jgi:uncharacterized protein YukE